MSETIYDFRSDNVGAAAPELIEALVAANVGTAGPYGDDEWTRRLIERAGEVFERPVRAFPLACGTGSNSIALAATANPFGAVYCHETAHINVHECGAPELFTGAKLVALPGARYKLSAGALEEALAPAGRGNPTRVQPFALNLTQPTDFGTLYSPAEIAALAEIAHRRGLKVHMDGARFANAVAATGCSPAELTWRSGVDVLLSPEMRSTGEVMGIAKDFGAAFHAGMSGAGVDLPQQKVTTADGQSYSFEVDAFRKHCLVNGLDDIGLTLQHVDKIKTFEAKHKQTQPWLFN